MNKTMIILALALVSTVVFSQVGIGTTNPDPSAILDVDASPANDKGFLAPRMTTTQRDAINGGAPANGLVIYNTDEKCLEVYNGTDWYNLCNNSTAVMITGLDCANATQTGTLTDGTPASGVSFEVPYTGGNGGNYPGESVTSTGVTGLTATLAAGSLVSGNGTVTYNVSNTPSGSGTASFAISLGGQSCTVDLTVNAPLITSGACAGELEEIIHNGLTYRPIEGTNGACWLDRNLGATQVATSATDPAAHGDLFQWGRATEGHESRSSSTYIGPVAVSTPGGHAWDGLFVTTSSEFTNWANDVTTPTTLWQGGSGDNNPCPPGFRVPNELELSNEVLSWPNDRVADGFASPLKMTATGYRQFDGTIQQVGSEGRWYTSTNSGGDATSLVLRSSNSHYFDIKATVEGYAVRCIKN